MPDLVIEYDASNPSSRELHRRLATAVRAAYPEYTHELVRARDSNVFLVHNVKTNMCVGALEVCAWSAHPRTLADYLFTPRR